MADRSYARSILSGASAAATCGLLLALADFVVAIATTDTALEGRLPGLLQGLVQSLAWAMAHSLVFGTVALLVTAARQRLLRKGTSRWLVDGVLLVAAAAIYMVAIGLPSLKRPSAVKIGAQCVMAACFIALSVVGIKLSMRATDPQRTRRIISVLGLVVLSLSMLVANQVVYPILMSRMHLVIIILPTVWVTLALSLFLDVHLRRIQIALTASALALSASIGVALLQNPYADFVVFRMTGYAKVGAMSADAVRAALGHPTPRISYNCASAPIAAPSRVGSGDWTIVILVDTLRSDHVFGPLAAPEYSKLVAESRAYANTHSQFGCTDYSVRSMLISGYDFQRPGDRATSLVRALRAPGGVDVAVASTAITRRFYEAAGFPPTHPTSSADDSVVVEHAKAWLATRVGRKAFLWVHLLGAHEAGLGDRRSYADRARDSATLVSSFVADIDRLVGRDGATIVLLSDHGESLGAHGLGEHCATAYDAVSRVPLLLRGPGIAPSIITTPTELIDLAPTLLALEGQPCTWCTGTDLLSQVPSDTCAVHISKVIRSQVVGLTCERWKLIEDRTFGFAELYDLKSDPGEIVNLAAEHPDIVAQLRERLKRHLRSPQACLANAERPRVPPQ